MSPRSGAACPASRWAPDDPLAVPPCLRLGAARLFWRGYGGAACRRLDRVRLLADSQRRHHLLSLVLFYWGLVLAAEQVLPRIGYADDPAAWLCGEGRPDYSTQSAMKMFVSPGLAALRLEAKTSRFPSGLNIGKASNSGLVVTCSSPLPSSLTR